MALVRAGEADSDVYVYVVCACSCSGPVEPCGRGGLRCCGPRLDSAEDAIAHLDEHRAKGHHVPEFVYDQIRAGVEGAPYRPHDTFSFAFAEHLGWPSAALSGPRTAEQP